MLPSNIHLFNMGQKEQIIFADDHLKTREVGFGLLFSEIQQAGHNIVGTGTNVKEVKKVINDLKEKNITPTLAVLDGNMPSEGDGAKAAEILREAFPDIKVIALSSSMQNFGDHWLHKSNSDGEIASFITSF